jgi:hypothetical protein
MEINGNTTNKHKLETEAAKQIPSGIKSEISYTPCRPKHVV